MVPMVWGQTLNTILFSQTFRAHPGYPSQNPGISRQKVCFPWVSTTCRTFWFPHLHLEDPHPIERYPDPKACVLVFACLRMSTFLTDQPMLKETSFCSQVETHVKTHSHYPSPVKAALIVPNRLIVFSLAHQNRIIAIASDFRVE